MLKIRTIRCNCPCQRSANVPRTACVWTGRVKCWM